MGKAWQIQSASNLTLEYGFHAAHVFNQYMYNQVRTDGLKAPGGERSGIEVAAPVPAEASSAGGASSDSEVLAGRSSKEEDARAKG
jgi:hypothetical protein